MKMWQFPLPAQLTRRVDMALYRRKETVSATQWFKDGDHPSVVDNFGSHPPKQPCPVCGFKYKRHRLIKHHSATPGHCFRIVCPGDWLVEDKVRPGCFAVLCSADFFEVYEAVAKAKP